MVGRGTWISRDREGTGSSPSPLPHRPNAHCLHEGERWQCRHVQRGEEGRKRRQERGVVCEKVCVRGGVEEKGLQCAVQKIDLMPCPVLPAVQSSPSSPSSWPEEKTSGTCMA